MRNKFQHYFPILDWSRRYNRQTFSSDLLAAFIVTIMLIPQSLAYALLAGLPAEVGIYASVAPIILYAIFGTSQALAVGPVAIVSLMTAAAIGKVTSSGAIDPITAALTLAFLSGLILLTLGILRLGFLASFLSHPVIAGFITASGVIIAASQLKHIFGIGAQGHSLIEIVISLYENIAQLNSITLVLGGAMILFLFWVRAGLKALLENVGLPSGAAGVIVKTGPIFAVVASTSLVWFFDLSNKGVSIVGDVPQGLPPLTSPSPSLELWGMLLGSAFLISIIGFVESVSVAQTLAAKKRQRIVPDQELLGLGAANVGAAFTGGYPVTGGFARSVVNYDAGASTPAAGIFTAAGLLFASLFLTPLLYYLPKATLAATIIVAVLSLVDFSILRRAWNYSKSDFFAVSITIATTWTFGVEIGVVSGVLFSILLHLYKSCRPHFAIVGQVPNTEHYRNVLRHQVKTWPSILSIRVDESLYFANARFLEDTIYGQIAEKSEIEHVILMCSAINEIDLSALESLETINDRLNENGIQFHLSEVKGPVMDRFKEIEFLKHLSGQVFLSQHLAIQSLAPQRMPEDNVQ